MLITPKDNRQVYLRKLKSKDFDKLFIYLQHLSEDTKKRFGPHLFDRRSIIDVYSNTDFYSGYIAIDIESADIIAYAIIKIGYLEHDASRLQSYGVMLSNTSDCTFAPSVADEWQSCGVGNSLFQFILSELKATKVKRIFLWGGVQASNKKAVNFYKRNAFVILGQFYHLGDNYDMLLDIL
ncbi:GNAT family N-acetyltransferase [Ferruginibacter sp.]|nr:GNAT family N-acetyltransferase [Ferruginibacter sp.]